MGEGAEAMFRTPSPQSPPLKGGVINKYHINLPKSSRLLAFILLCCCVLSAHSRALGASDTPECSIDLGPCITTAAGTQIIFDISPKPVKTMKELTFIVSVGSRNAAPTLLLDLSMPGMYMGRNKVVLKKTADGRYSGKGIIPRCPSGKKIWRSEATIPGAGKVSFTFNVSQ